MSITFAVSAAKNLWLQKRMLELEIKESDLEERFVRSSGRAVSMSTKHPLPCRCGICQAAWKHGADGNGASP